MARILLFGREIMIPCPYGKETMSQLFRLNISKKLFLGYLPYGILTILIAVIALTSLRQLNEINNRIIRRDIPLVEITDKMIDALLAQELYGRRSLILKSPEMEVLFWKRSEEFKKLLQQMRNLPDPSSLHTGRLATLHEEYNHLFKIRLDKKDKLPSGTLRDDDLEIGRKQEELVQLAKKISQDSKEDQAESGLKTLTVGHSAFWLTAGLSMGGLFLGITIILIITRSISSSIDRLKLSTQKISEGKFDHLPEVRDQDELGDLYRAFQQMARRLKRLEEMYLDANSLTRLPGSAAIESVLRKRLEEQKPLAFCELDLSHFKAFNDRYGYARGNEVIQAPAKIVSGVVRAEGNEESFVGHIGGDDFVVITSPVVYEKICLAIIDSFDRVIPNFYDPEDRQRGYIRGATRQGEKDSFPIMTLAIAVVTNRDRQLQNHIQVGEIAAELKSYAKSFSRSILVADRRRGEPERGSAKEPVIN